MIKQGIKNYFTALKNFFTPLGTMFLGMMIGFSILLPGVLSAVSTLVNGVKGLAESVNLDFNVLFGKVWVSVQALNWSSPLAAIRTLFSREWLDGTLTQALQTILGTDFDTFRAELLALIGDCVSAVKWNVIAFLFFWVLGFVFGYFLLKFQIRRQLAKRSLLRFLLITLLNSFLTTAFVFAAIILLFLWRWSIVISAILIILLASVFALVEAYLAQGQKEMPFKSIVNARNAGLYALTNFIIFLISLAITVVAFLINGLMGLFVGLTLIEIAIIVTSLNAESYVIGFLEKKE